MIFVNKKLEIFMSFSSRLVEERKRLKIKQKELASILGIHINSQLDYEKGRIPSFGSYLERLSELGFDIQYIISGERGHPVLSSEDADLLEKYRNAPSAFRMAAVSALSAANHPQKGRSERSYTDEKAGGKNVTQTAIGDRAKIVNVDGGIHAPNKMSL